MSVAQKRKRSPNWLHSEKILLLDLVEEHFHIIENKKTDGVSVKKKLAEWKLIEGKYNSQTPYNPRSADSLKLQWENMKKTGKREEANYRIDVLKTGSGHPKERKYDLDLIHTRVMRLVETTASGLLNPFDGDFMAPAVVMVQEDEEEINDEEIFAKESNCGSPSLQDETNDRSNNTPAMLQTPVSSALNQTLDTSELSKNLNVDSDKNVKKTLKIEDCPAQRRPKYTATSSSLEKLHQKKIEALELQKEIACQERDSFEERNKLDVEILKEKLKQERIKTRILLLEARLKKKQLKNYEEANN